ncbi:PREDICTED: uncharacterized protein LOC108758343 [Trachymyrmex cornetzi]|uniref:Uncharacterized protein n=1 Tax=Trachymyrmex cornetzi TaxID=471704 RepID=A0A195EDI0_9HYME|nr:PREDICTED: uncharacterized protein LOC108758343 [Trachymyrmex cornetzi]XP_018358736.1 PREDICTED: uncharacterized protein LOC108758343 [Trachymyrmex cornetzi]KYN23280.1 hypothetical protein ALC57_04153 [Trachymyrmex cornetzi]
MKIPLLILCMAVVYGTCRTYNEGDHVTKAIQNNGDYKNYANMPFEKSLMRYKRTISTSVIPTSINALLSLLGFNDVRCTDETFMTFINNLLTGKDVLFKIASANISTLLNQEPFNFISSIIMSFFNTVSNKIFEVAKDFFLVVFLPALHTLLNAAMKNLPLPPQISAMITTFNAMYGILQILGYVK